MAQRAARADIPTRSAPDLSTLQDLEGLGRDWTVLRSCRLRPGNRSSSPAVLIHPGRGIAVLDVPPSATPDAVEAVRSRLDAARFDGIFTGHLPVVHLRAAPRQTPLVAKLLDDAFAALPPLDLPGGDAWAGVAARALLAEEHPAAPRGASGQASRGAAEESRPPRARARRRRGAALRKAGAFLLCLAALGGVVAVTLRELPLPDASTRAAAPPGGFGEPSTSPPPPAGAAAPHEATVLPTPAPDRGPPEPAVPVPNGVRATAPVLEAPPPTPSVPPTPAGGATSAPPQRAVPAAPRRAEPPPQQARKPLEEAPPPQQQQRRSSGGADSSPAAGGGGAAPPDAVAQRCGRVEARIASGAPIPDADMRFFNQACIRW